MDTTHEHTQSYSLAHVWPLNACAYICAHRRADRPDALAPRTSLFPGTHAYNMLDHAPARRRVHTGVQEAHLPTHPYIGAYT